MYIKIVTNNGPRRVNAALVGHFGVHRNLVGNADGKQAYGDTWAVTHLSTGFALCQGFHSKRWAIVFAKSLRSSAWSSGRWRFGERPNRSQKFTKDAVADLLRSLTEFGISIADAVSASYTAPKGEA